MNSVLEKIGRLKILPVIKIKDVQKTINTANQKCRKISPS